MRKLFFLSIMMTFAGILFYSCDDKEEPKKLDDPAILSFKITNAGAASNELVECMISGDTIKGTVSFETSLTTLVPEIEVPEGSVVTPASGVPQDFTNPRTYIVSNKDKDRTYTVVIGKTENPTKPTLTYISFKDRSSVIDYANKRVIVDITTVQQNSSGLNVTVDSLVIFPLNGVCNRAENDVIDLAVDSLITISDGKESVEFIIRVNLIEIGFNFSKTQVLLDASALASAIPTDIASDRSRCAEYYNGKVYVPYFGAGGPDIFIYDITKPASQTPDTVNMTGVGGGNWGIADLDIVDGTIIASNMAGYSAGTDLKIYRWTDKNAAPQLLTSYTCDNKTRLGDAISIIGDPNGNAKIYVSGVNFNEVGKLSNQDANKLLVVTLSGGTVTSTELKVLPEVPLYPDGFHGQYTRVHAIPGSDKYLVIGANAASLMNPDLTLVQRVVGIPIRGLDPRFIEFNGAKYIMYGDANEYGYAKSHVRMLDVTGYSSFEEALKNMANDVSAPDSPNSLVAYIRDFAVNGDPWITACTGLEMQSDGAVIMGMTTLKGFFVDKLKK